MKLSVVVVGYNAASYGEKCLQSLFDQSLDIAEYEVIFFDNQSQDNTVALIQSNFPNVQLIKSNENLGYYGGFNYVAENIAQSEYLLALPQDTILHHNCLEELVKAADTDPQLMVALVNTINPNAVEYSAKNRKEFPEHVYWCSTNRFGQTNLIKHEFFHLPKKILAYSGVAALIRRDAKELIFGYFDSNLSHLVGDSELGIRATVLGYNCKIVPTAIIFHIEDNKSFTKFSFLRNSFVGARDSVLIYLKLMYTLEFLLFSPLLLLGQATKVFTLRFPLWQRIVLFFPALLASPLTFLLALLRFNTIRDIRQRILNNRRNGRFSLLQTVFFQTLNEQSNGQINLGDE